MKKSVLFFTVFVWTSHGINVLWNKSQQRENDIALISEIINLITDPCITDPCQNDGICIATENRFKCICDPPYSGETCSEDISVQYDILMTTSNHSMPISNSTYQYLTDKTGSYEETSSDSSIIASDENVTWTENNSTIDIMAITLRNKKHDTSTKGIDVQYDILMTTSNHSMPISNNTYQYLTDKTGSYEETSSDSSIIASDENVTWTENNSIIDITTITLRNEKQDASTKETCETDNDCLNGGTCRSKGNKRSCDCTPNFGGAMCEVNLLCVPIDQSCRLINAVCVVIDDHAICECPNGTLYHRKSGLCEDICDSRKCFQGKCEIIGKTYRCNCDQGYTGSHCDEKEKGKHENFVPWFTVIASINLLICVLLIAMFSVLCQIKTFIKSP